MEVEIVVAKVVEAIGQKFVGFRRMNLTIPMAIVPKVQGKTTEKDIEIVEEGIETVNYSNKY